MTGFLANALTRNLARVFRDRASLTSVSKLRREGYRTVSVLQVSRLEELIGAAIERVMTDVTADPATGRRMARGAQVEFLRMLGERDSLSRATEELKREQNNLVENLGSVQGALAEARQELEQELVQQDQESFGELQTALDERLQELFARFGDSNPDAGSAAKWQGSLQPALRDAMLALLGTALRRRPGPESETSGAKVEVLERRIRKLNASLDEAQEMLIRLRENRDQEEAGVASMFKEAQGLRGTEKDFEQRRDLMKEIFQINLDLRSEIAGS